MIYTKPWEYRMGMIMMFFGAAVTIFAAVLFVVHLLQGNTLAALYLFLGVINGFYVGKYFRETKDYRARRRANG